MRRRGSVEAAPELFDLLERVARGESVTITRRGVPVAELSPVLAALRAERREAIEALIRHRAKMRLGTAKLSDLIAEGRR